MAVPKRITLEEHYVASFEGAGDRWTKWRMPILPKLQFLGDLRFNDMDAGSVNAQVISHAPIMVDAQKCRHGNDQLAKACKAHPSRFAGFAMPPMLDPEAAASELERAVQELGFVGALINSHEDGTFYDQEKYWPVFAKAVELDVPVYLHPSRPSQAMIAHYQGNHPDSAASSLSISSRAWHAEVGHHFLRLFAAGLFDRYPTLKLILGHDGGMVPFVLDRTSHISQRWGERKRDLRTVLKENVWVTTSAMFSLAPFACLLRVSDVDKILYSVEYPFSTNQGGLAFVKDLQKSGMVSAEELEMICHGNAEKLLKLPAWVSTTPTGSRREGSRWSWNCRRAIRSARRIWR